MDIDKTVASNLFGQIRFDDPNPILIEKDIHTFLSKIRRKNYSWSPDEIAPLADPVSLNDLVGDQLNGALNELRNSLGSVDTLYTQLSDLNNFAKSELTTAESLVQQATKDVQDVVLRVATDSTLLWLSDTFNTTVHTDSNASSCLVDTDLGQVILSPSSYKNIKDFSITVDHTQAKGIPGGGLYIVNQGTYGVPGENGIEPSPVLETNPTQHLTNIFDGDPNTWFELARYFVPTKQKMKRYGRAWRADTSGDEQDIHQITKDYDWNVNVQYGDQPPTGDATGVPLVEFVDNTPGQNESARIVFDVVFNTPTNISALNLVPFERDGSQLRIDKISAEMSRGWVTLAENTKVSAQQTLSILQSKELSKTGYSSTGTTIVVPLDIPISRIRFSLSSVPIPARYGIAHPFKEALWWHRQETHLLFISTAHEWSEWVRTPVNDKPPVIFSFTDLKQITTITGNLTTPNNVQAGQETVSSGTRGIISEQGTAVAAGLAYYVGSSVLGANAIAAGLAGGPAGLVLAGAVALAGAIFGGTTTQDDQVKEVKTGFDVLKGWRAGVGIKNLSFARYTFDSSGIFQSVFREFPAPVSKIGLIANEYIPTQWGENNWITYYISVDGHNWVPIKKLSDTTLDNSFTPDEPVTGVYLRAELKNNPADTFHSPILQSYALAGLPA